MQTSTTASEILAHLPAALEHVAQRRERFAAIAPSTKRADAQLELELRRVLAGEDCNAMLELAREYWALNPREGYLRIGHSERCAWRRRQIEHALQFQHRANCDRALATSVIVTVVRLAGTPMHSEWSGYAL